ncbi:MAG: alanine--glyoxylate aminotransferase family protein [Oligoflexus sp.]|nr:alanine--glyoxylate aminotransferase family protein [Oligoflexus sp.]
MDDYPFVKDRLYCPGPTPVPQASAIAALQTNVYHRTDLFREKFLRARSLLQDFFGSSEAPLILTSSGTGAMEAAMVNLTSPKERVLVLNGGKFGERWAKLASAYQCEVISYEFPWGEAPKVEKIKQYLDANPDIKAVFFQANETSTGVAYPVQEIAATIKSCSEAFVVVDAISALVAHDLPMDKLQIDCLLTGSQKGFGIPPGLAFISLSERAWKNLSSRPKFYFDLKKEREGQDKGETAWTPATTLVESLIVSLEVLAKLGPQACETHHKRMANACQKAASAMGLKLFSKSHHSHALTAIELPTQVDGSKLLKYCQARFGTVFAGGQDHLKGKIVRLAHLGIVDELDLIGGIAALEMGLQKLGATSKLGVGVTAAMQALNAID